MDMVINALREFDGIDDSISDAALVAISFALKYNVQPEAEDVADSEVDKQSMSSNVKKEAKEEEKTDKCETTDQSQLPFFRLRNKLTLAELVTVYQLTQTPLPWYLKDVGKEQVLTRSLPLVVFGVTLEYLFHVHKRFAFQCQASSKAIKKPQKIKLNIPRDAGLTFQPIDKQSHCRFCRQLLWNPAPPAACTGCHFRFACRSCWLQRDGILHSPTHCRLWSYIRQLSIEALDCRVFPMPWDQV